MLTFTEAIVDLGKAGPEDEPRDERGRWTEGGGDRDERGRWTSGGGGDVKHPGWKTFREVMENVTNPMRTRSSRWYMDQSRSSRRQVRKDDPGIVSGQGFVPIEGSKATPDLTRTEYAMTGDPLIDTALMGS